MRSAARAADSDLESVMEAFSGVEINGWAAGSYLHRLQESDDDNQSTTYFSHPDANTFLLTRRGSAWTRHRPKIAAPASTSTTFTERSPSNRAATKTRLRLRQLPRGHWHRRADRCRPGARDQRQLQHHARRGLRPSADHAHWRHRQHISAWSTTSTTIPSTTTSSLARSAGRWHLRRLSAPRDDGERRLLHDDQPERHHVR